MHEQAGAEDLARGPDAGDRREAGQHDGQGDLPGRRRGLIAMRMVISIGVAGGNNEATTEIVLDGFVMTGTSMNIGRMKSIITGIIIDWASLSSLHAEPTAM